MLGGGGAAAAGGGGGARTPPRGAPRSALWVASGWVCGAAGGGGVRLRPGLEHSSASAAPLVCAADGTKLMRLLQIVEAALSTHAVRERLAAHIAQRSTRIFHRGCSTARSSTARACLMGGAQLALSDRKHSIRASPLCARGRLPGAFTACRGRLRNAGPSPPADPRAGACEVQRLHAIHSTD